MFSSAGATRAMGASRPVGVTVPLDKFAQFAVNPDGVEGQSSLPPTSPPLHDVPNSSTSRKKRLAIFAVIAVVGIIGSIVGITAQDPAADEVSDIGRRLNDLVEANSYLADTPTFNSMEMLAGAIIAYQDSGSLPASAVSARDVDGTATMQVFDALLEAAPKKDYTSNRNLRVQGILGPRNLMQNSVLHSTNMARSLQSQSLPLWVLNSAATYIKNGVEWMTTQFTYQNDLVGVEFVGGNCYIIVKETNDNADWAKNLNARSAAIAGINNSNLGIIGHSGFVTPYNGLRAKLWSTMGRACPRATQYTFSGYSRGAGIAQVMVAAMTKQRLLSLHKINLITFGAPRALTASSASHFHSSLKMNLRIVYRDDPVPTVPYPWQAGDRFHHVGYLRCYFCTYTIDSNAPYFGWPLDLTDHLKYKSFSPYGSVDLRKVHLAIYT